MNLTDLSLILIGKVSKNKTVSLFFPNIPSRHKNILDINIKKSTTSNSTLSRIINFNYSGNLRSNSINTTLIDILIKITQNDEDLNSLLDAYLETIDDIEYFSQQNNKKIIDCFKHCLILIDKNNLISKKYLDIINTYILNEKYNIVLFLMGSLLILSSAIKNKENFDENDIRYKNLNRALEIIDDFENYVKYLNKKDYLYQEYIPIQKESSSTIEIETYPTEQTYSFENFENLLDESSCKEIHIISRFAHNWAYNNTYDKMVKRLKENSLIVKMLLMDINTSFAHLYNDKQNSIEYNHFGIFEDLARKFPNNFQLRYVTIPLTNRMFQDCSNNKMRVDFLTTPSISKDVFKKYFDKNNPQDTLYYDQYSRQFDELWTKYSRDIHTIYDYSKFSYGIASNVNDKMFYDFYHYCIKNSKNIGVISPTASSWTNYNYLTYKLYEKLQEKDFHIEFIVLRPNTYNFKIALENRKYACTSNIENLDRFKDLIEKYPNQVSVYATDLFISDTITIDFSNQIMRVDNHILNSKSSYNIKPSMIIPNNQTDIYGYYSEYLQQYEFIKNHKDTHKLI